MEVVVIRASFEEEFREKELDNKKLVRELQFEISSYETRLVKYQKWAMRVMRGLRI